MYMYLNTYTTVPTVCKCGMHGMAQNINLSSVIAIV